MGIKRSEQQSKPTSLPVNQFISEGNPNTQQKIEEETGSPVPEVTVVAHKHKDEQLSKDIQIALSKDALLAACAENIRIKVDNDYVTLQGAVHTEQEKTTATDKAAAFVGLDKVKNCLTVDN